MAKILVLYHSNSGNTRRMAELVAEGAAQLQKTEVRLKDISVADHTDLDWCDGIALGSPTNYGCVSWQMKKWWDEQPIENWVGATARLAAYLVQRDHGAVGRSGPAWRRCRC